MNKTTKKPAFMNSLHSVNAIKLANKLYWSSYPNEAMHHCRRSWRVLICKQIYKARREMIYSNRILTIRPRQLCILTPVVYGINQSQFFAIRFVSSKIFKKRKTTKKDILVDPWRLNNHFIHVEHCKGCKIHQKFSLLYFFSFL